MESHLQSAMGFHLDLTCVELRNTQAELKNAQETIRKLEEVEIKDTQETIRKLEQVELKDARERIRKLEETRHTRKMVWKIDEFSSKMSEAKNRKKKKVESVPFYTDSPGYKLKVACSPNGSKAGKNTHLSVFIIVMKGEYDAILPWPFNKKVTFTLIDQEEDPLKRENFVAKFTPDDDKSYCRPIEEQNPGRGKPQFISHLKLRTGRYVVDDTLFLQVEIGR